MMKKRKCPRNLENKRKTDYNENIDRWKNKNVSGCMERRVIQGYIGGAWNRQWNLLHSW